MSEEKQATKAPSAPVASEAKKAKVKDPRFKGHKAPAVASKGKTVVVEKISKVNMTLHNGTHLAKGDVVPLSQDDIDLLNKHHIEGYEDNFFEDASASQIARVKARMAKDAKAEEAMKKAVTAKPEVVPEDEDVEDDEDDEKE